MGIKGFPTLKTVKPTLSHGKPIIADYQGARTAAGIIEAVKGIIPNHVKRITDKGLNDWLKESNDTAKAILFSDKGTTSALIKVLASHFYGNMPFAQIRDKDTVAVATFGIEKYPTLLVLPGGTAPVVIYDGQLEKTAMAEFLGKYAAPATPPRQDSKQNPLKDKKKRSSSKPAQSSTKSSKASSSQDTAKATESAASATTITLEDPNQATPSPDPIVAPEDAATPVSIPNIPPPLSQLESPRALKAQCLGPKTSTCIVALLPPSTELESTLPNAATIAQASLSEIEQKHKNRGAHIFPFFAIPASNSASEDLRSGLGLKGNEVEVVAVNGRRSWYKKFDSAKGFGFVEIEGWIDEIRLGEGKKEKLPEGLVVETVEKEPEPSILDSIKNNLPDGLKVEMVEDLSEEGIADILRKDAEQARAAGEFTAKEAQESVKSATQQATKKAAEAAEAMADGAGSIKEKAAGATDQAAAAADQIKSRAADATSVVSQEASGASSAAKDQATEAAASVASAVEKAKAAAASASSIVNDKAADATEVVKEKISEVAGQVKEGAEKVQSKVDERKVKHEEL